MNTISEPEISIRQIEYRPFYDTKWLVEIQIGNVVEVYTLTRDETETEGNLIQEIRGCLEKDLPVNSLDCRNKIFYD